MRQKGRRKLIGMRNTDARRTALISAAIPLFVSIAFAAVEKGTVRYDYPVRAIRGRVTAAGRVIPVSVWVDVYDNAEVRLDDSMPPAEQRKKQTRVASVQPNDEGDFSIKHLRKGFYEVEVGNHGMGGYHVLSVLVNVDPRGTNDRLCVDLGLEGGNSHGTVAKCSTR